MISWNAHYLFVVSSAVLLGMALTGPVSADDAPRSVRSKTVRFADLNTHSPAGIAVLYRRIHLAAEDLCDVSGSDYRYFLDQIELRTCVRNAEDDAVRAANIPMLTAYYDQKRGRKGVILAGVGRQPDAAP
jgi:UrcA family protein